MGHGGGLHKKTPAQVARAHDSVTTYGFTVVAIDVLVIYALAVYGGTRLRDEV